MSLFGEQISSRVRKDRGMVSDALLLVADTVSGEKRFHAKESGADLIRTEVERICNYFKLNVPEKVPKTDNVNDLIDYLVRPSGIMKRRVLLEDLWWKNGDGPLLAVKKEDGEMCALIPARFSGYRFFDNKQGVWRKVDAQTKNLFEINAVCFYRPFPVKSMDKKDLLLFLFRNMSFSDKVLLVTSGILMTLFGVLTPIVTGIVFARIIPAGKSMLLVSSIALLLSAAVSIYLMTTVKTVVLSRISTWMDTMLQNAAMGRLLSMPVSFFSDKSSGALSQCVGALTLLPNVIAEVFMGTGFLAVVNLLYIIQIALMSPALAWPAMLTFVLEFAVIGICFYQKTRLMRAQLRADEESQGLVFALFSGIQKIKLSGSENRAFAKWGTIYEKKVRASYRQPFPAFFQNEMVIAVQMFGMLIAYAAAAGAGATVAEFAAFSSAIGMIIATLLQLSAMTDPAACLLPVLEMSEPLLKAEPEISASKTVVEHLSGSIELNGVSFRYVPDGPKIVDQMNLKIKPGEYVAIVGKSGCGKSTLMRLMLGFEEPDEGSIYYDGRDLNSLDMPSFRRNIGTVLQSGSLFSGDVFSNITISAPWLNMDDAWEAARMAGMEEDIENMPMKMHTFISEGGGGISGGQKQRLMIARAIAPKPSILIFDEATSALDNITQKTVSDSLNSIHCTRIVIAHRLSTIKECDRIIVLDAGRIVEDGAYDELIEKGGYFAELVKRQMVETPKA
ncbi:MAG: ATP-binding cassette domain-containing protein [Lachnospiraceae bacterium]|nr:ATP-binding cassette domain-containing protein [Lachnospiraceae bacterium]